MSSPSTTAIGDSTGFIQRLANAFGTPNANITLDLCGWGRAFATRYTYGVGSVGAGGMGAMPDIENSGVLILWGYNPSFTRLTHATAVVAALKRGMRLIVVDPRHVGLAGKADLWLRALPSLRKRAPHPAVELHPTAAQARRIANGDWVSIETPEGSVRARARLNADLDPRVVVGEHGWWQGCAELGASGYDPFGPMGANFNLLIGTVALDPVSGTASHRSYLCEIRPIAQEKTQESEQCAGGRRHDP